MIELNNLKSKPLIKILIGVATILLLIGVMSTRRPAQWKFKVEDVSSTSIYAPFDFSYVDEESTLKLQKERAAAVNLLYDYDPSLFRKSSTEIFNFYQKILNQKIIANKDEQTGLTVAHISVTLRSKGIDEIYRKTEELLNVVMGTEVIGEDEKMSLLKKGIKIITVRNLLTNVEREQDLIQVLVLKDTRKEFIDKAIELFPENRKLRTEVVELVDNFIEPTLHYNEQQTLRCRQAALNDTKPVMKNVRKNKLIVDKGQIITPEQVVQLSTVFKKRVQVDILSTNLGMGLLVIIFVVLLGVYIYRYSPKIYEDNRKLILISLILFLSIALGQLVGVSQLSRYLIPMSAGAMLIAILLEARLAVMIAALSAVFAGVIAGSKLDVSVVSFAGSLAGIYFVIGVRRRSQLIMAGFLVGLASFVCIIGMELLNRIAPSIFIVDASWGFASGIVSAIVVTIILPVLEYIFKITTNISLLELSDLNHPLLRKMLTLAPGTYHHSLVVGNLAEAASEAVGANSLLARVASYYHDIGKIEKAEYFIENERFEKKSKHDKLTPSMSSLIIINHVKNGVELAQKYNLNKAIVDIIREHHGASQVFYFYKKALEKIEDKEMLEAMAFRYPGPKPQTRESAIVLLADSIEAASRSLSDPTPGSIKGMVQKIINNKFIDGQLEECELVLKDLHKIADSFVQILIGIFHTRVEYPEAGKGPEETETDEDKNKKYPKKGQDKKHRGT